jgi:hypothetical protein
MTVRHWSGGALFLGVLAAGTTALNLRAQQGPPLAAAGAKRDGAISVQDALTRPYNFPFAKPTPLSEVVEHLGKTLNAPVALDRAALDRLDVRTDDTLQLELHGVRLKTGLRLLLDQLDLTYRVEPEDNLLVITDLTGADDPFQRVLSEVKSLHRDVHDLQDDLDGVRAALGLTGEGGAKMRKPTIIEEVPPGDEKAKPKDAPPATNPPRPRSGA